MKTVLIDINNTDWNKFKSNCVLNEISVKDGITKLILESIKEGNESNETKERKDIPICD